MNSSSTARPVVVGIDGSTSALHAALWAADEAAPRHVPLRLVHAGGAFTMGDIGGLAPPQSFFDAMQTYGDEVLTGVETAIRRRHPELDISMDVHLAAPVQTLVEQTHDARLLVLGSRGKGGFHGILVGSTAVALVTHGHCPVAVVRGRTDDEAPPTAGPVVVGVDASPTSEAALAAAFDEASWRRAELVAVHAWIEFSGDPTVTSRYTPEWDVVRENEAEMLAERMAGWQEKYPDVAVRRVVTHHPVMEALLTHAGGAQLLVVGSRGHGGLTGMLLGSTSQALVYHAPCPLLVVRPAAA